LNLIPPTDTPKVQVASGFAKAAAVLVIAAVVL
jgi:hypothetical protein